MPSPPALHRGDENLVLEGGDDTFTKFRIPKRTRPYAVVHQPGEGDMTAFVNVRRWPPSLFA